MKRSGRRLLVWGVILWALAGTAYGTLRLTYGQRPAYVHVRWAPMVDAAETGPPFASGGPPRVARTSPRGPAWIAAALEFLVPALFAMGALVGVGGLFNTWRERRGQGAAEGAES